MIETNAITTLKQIPKKNSNRTFLIDSHSGKQIQYKTLDEKAKGIGKLLKDFGFKKGDRITVILDNSISTIYFYFGCLYSGISVVPVNSTMTHNEINHIIKNSNSKGIIINENTKEKFNSKSMNYLKIIHLDYFESKKKNSHHDYFIDVNALPEINEFISFQNVNQNDEMCVVYSAGTTSQPKAIPHTIKDLVHNAQLFGKIVGINSQNRFCNMLSLMYLGGYYNLLILPYVLNSSVLLTTVFNPTLAVSFWDPIIKNHVNTLWLVPSIMSILLELDRTKKGKIYCKKNIRLALSGTAPLPQSVKQAFEKNYNVKIFENYGLSETLFVSTVNPKNYSSNSGLGKVLPNVKIRIVDKQGKEISNGDEGEILVKTPYLTEIFANQTNSKKLSQGWFETGDLGKIIHQNLFITGRKKDLIIRGGINISPANIENIFHKNKHVLECAVVGIPHKFQGEEIIAVIRINENENFEKIKDALNISCKKNLSTLEQPSRIVNLKQFPHATYGKIQKNKIRSWLENSKQVNESSKKSKKIKLKPRNLPLSKIVTKSIEATSIRYNTKVYEKQRKGEDVIVMSLGEAFFDIPLFSFDDLPFPKLYHYSHSKGIPELRKKLQEYFLETYDVSFDYENEILITAGSKIAIYMCLIAILDFGDDVLIHEPAWVSFPEQIKLAHGNPIRIPLHKSIYDFEDYITPKTKLIIINNPHNPTGKLYSLEEMSYLYNLAKKYNLYILSDEAYSDFVYNQDRFISFGNLDVKKENSIIINSISKNFGISGWRLGYIITNEKLINQILKINQHLITCPPTMLEYYIEKHFDEIIQITKPQIEKLIEKRKQIINFMNKNDLKFLPGETTFYIFASIADSKLNSEEFCSQLLQKYGVSVVPGIGYGDSCDNFIRISIGSENMKRVKTGLNFIRKLIKSTSF